MFSTHPLADGVNECRHGSGALIINADDWGRDTLNTDRIFDCVGVGAVSSVSAMVFMEDSERAAALALERRIDAGLHLNLTERFSQMGAPERLCEHQERVALSLRQHRLRQVLYDPRLSKSFDYVVQAQMEEFSRIYHAEPQRIDGHHHMHLCANVLYANLLPEGTIVRRSFSFAASEKGFINRMYRRLVDTILARRHRMADFFYSLPPMDAPGRLARIFNLARDFAVEVETHPARPSEYAFLTSGDIFRVATGVPVASRYSVLAVSAFV